MPFKTPLTIIKSLSLGVCKFSFILISLYSYSQTDINCNKTSIYKVARGTNAKNDIVSKRFNLKNKNITHIGLGICNRDKIKIYNTFPFTNKEFRIDTLNSFFGVRDVFYKAIWKLNIGNKKIRKLKKTLKSFKNLSFDYKFDLNNNNAMYCSEFVAKMLNYIDGLDFNPTLCSKPPKAIIKKGQNFYYFPVDFFITNNKFNIIFEKETIND